MKKLFYFLVILFSLSIPLSILKISTDIQIPIIVLAKDDTIATLIINKIHLKEPLYQKDSDQNTIEKHISILKESTFPDKKNSTMILAAHSGTAGVSFFQNLNQLEINDTVEILYQGKTYQYLVKEIWREKKTGYIYINREPKKHLILTTCDPIQKEYQIIVSCTEKES